jgi:hypothetical protein
MFVRQHYALTPASDPITFGGMGRHPKEARLSGAADARCIARAAVPQFE